VFGEGGYKIKKGLLIFGVPGEDFPEFLKVHYPSGQWRLWCAESRPYETLVSGQLGTFVSRDYETVVIADNMIGFCIAQKKVDCIMVFYRHLSGGYAYCQGGSLLMAVLARELGVVCNLYPTDFDPAKAAAGNSLCFAGENITPRGAQSYIPLVDKVPLSYCAEKW
jgi:methylthioribose-1-phosphate isomerase